MANEAAHWQVLRQLEDNGRFAVGCPYFAASADLRRDTDLPIPAVTYVHLTNREMPLSLNLPVSWRE